MYPKGVALIIVILLGLIHFQIPSALSHSSTPRGELVVVLNKSLANPLGGEIWLMTIDGRLVRRITKNRYHEEHPKFSPDGSRIVFVRNMSGVVPGVGIDPKHNEIFVYDSRKGVETRLTRNKVEDGHPEWSYDGEYIAFYSRRNHPEGKATLWVMKSDGSRPTQIAFLRPGDLSHVDPAWGPAGQWLAFVNHREEGGVRYSRVEKVRLDGTQRTVLSSGGKFPKPSRANGQGQLGDLDPDYSPDGAMICSVRRLAGGNIHLFSFGANAYYGGKAEIEMSWPHNSDVVERTPQFSPDGRRIVLTRSSPKTGHRTRQIVLTDPQSSFRRYLTSWEKWDVWQPSWHPFAHSGADRDTASTVVHYKADDLVGSRPISAQKNDGIGAVRDLQSPDGVRFVTGGIRTSVPKADQTAAYEARWKLDIPTEKVISLTLRFQGKLSGVGSEGRSLRFRLMDWQEKRWVTIFVRRDLSNGKIKILHEFTPANFIKRDTRQVLLRIVALGSPATSAPTLETDHLSLDVRRE